MIVEITNGLDIYGHIICDISHSFAARMKTYYVSVSIVYEMVTYR
jgi:hypothetical protein